ncbi:MAG TPA: hypothetical protein DEA47_04670 [Peptococcaceae bacterium]|nr:MAG: Copper amine oxidase-like domain-containing protein [Clostridia bacterium 41_269]HBT20638.1 hypothetical protein [Peptococcaceae bacterium]
MRRKKFLFAALAAVIIVILCAGTLSASTGVTNLKTVFKNIKIIADGMEVASTDAEPFMVGNRVFVPLRTISEALGAKVHWDSATSKVIINSDTSEVEALQQQLIEKQQRINELENQVSQLNARIADLEAQLQKKENEETSDLSDLEDELIDEFDELEGVVIDDISLDGDEENLEVEIEVDLGKYDDEWAELSDRDIEDWIEDLVQYIHDELDEDCYVEGTIIDVDSDDDLVKFEKDGEDGDLEVGFYDEDYR